MTNIPYGFPLLIRLTSLSIEITADFPTPIRTYAFAAPFSDVCTAHVHRVRSGARAATGVQVFAAGRRGPPGATGQAGQGRSHPAAALHAVSGGDQGSEDHGADRRAPIERLYRRAAAELRRALQRDQQSVARAGTQDLYAGGDPPPDRPSRDRRVSQERSGSDAERCKATRRELRAPRLDLSASDEKSDDERQPGRCEHAVDA